MKKEDQPFIFQFRTKEDGTRVYATRFTFSSVYQDFYKWVANSGSYHCLNDDMPWDVFRIDNPEEEVQMLNMFGKHLEEVDEDDNPIRKHGKERTEKGIDEDQGNG